MNSDPVSLVTQLYEAVARSDASAVRVQDGKIRVFQQYTDTTQFVAATTP